jgi:hypothetical protein
MKIKFNRSGLRAYANKKAVRFVRAATIAAVAELKDIDDPGGQEIIVRTPEIDGGGVRASVGISSPYAIVSELGSETRAPKPYVSKLATDATRRNPIVAAAAKTLKI